MSSQLTQLVPVFDGTNYSIWSKAIKAFLMSQGLWGHAAGTLTLAPGAAPELVEQWNRLNDMTKGHIALRLTPPIQAFVEEFNLASEVWQEIFDRYGTASVPSVYKDFKEAISIRFNTNQHPAPQFDKLAAAFSRLGSVSVGTAPNVTQLSLAKQVQALIAMAALPPKWEVLVPIICQGEDLNDLDLSLVRNTVIAQYETEANRGQHRNHTANRLSAVKRKRGDPRFNQQQGSSQQRPSTSSNQQQHRQRGSRGKGRGGSINKGKQRAHNPVL